MTKFARKISAMVLTLLLLFLARTCATNISKELTELVIEELVTQSVIFNKKTVQDLESFYKLKKTQIPIPTANSFIEISQT